jgi:hypothetical protein
MLIVSFYRSPSRGWRGLFLPFLGGLLLGMATLTITLGLLTRMPFSMDLPYLYSWAWIRGPGWPMMVAVPVVSAIYLRRPTSYSRIREITAWLSGVAFLYTIWYAMTPDPGFDNYRVFLSPFIWIASIGSISWLTDRGLRIDGWTRWILLAAATGFSLLITFLPVLYSFGETLYSSIIALVFAIGSTLLAFLDSRGRLG